MVLDEGVLFRTNETAFVETKRKMLNECNLHCIVSLAGGVFNAAGAGVKTNLLFFNKGEPTEKIWYYDLSGRERRRNGATACEGDAKTPAQKELPREPIVPWH